MYPYQQSTSDQFVHLVKAKIISISPGQSNASNANDVRGQKTDAGQTGDYVESCVRADDDERDENSKNHRYSASIERDVHARSHLSKLVLVLGR